MWVGVAKEHIMNMHVRVHVLIHKMRIYISSYYALRRVLEWASKGGTSVKEQPWQWGTITGRAETCSATEAPECHLTHAGDFMWSDCPLHEHRAGWHIFSRSGTWVWPLDADRILSGQTGNCTCYPQGAPHGTYVASSVPAHCSPNPTLNDLRRKLLIWCNQHSKTMTSLV